MSNKLNQSDLSKGLDALKNAANKNNPLARRNELFQKAQSGTITTDENDELVKSLSGRDLVEAATASLNNNDTLQKSIDVSDFLREQHKGVVDGISALAEHIQKSDSDDHGFRVALATTITGLVNTVEAQGSLIKSMSEKLGVAMTQPARGPKSAGVNAGAQPMNKSFAGAAPTQNVDTQIDGSELSKSQILDVMEEMNKSSSSGKSASGESLMHAISKYESTNQISPTMLRDVASFTKQA